MNLDNSFVYTIFSASLGVAIGLFGVWFLKRVESRRNEAEPEPEHDFQEVMLFIQNDGRIKVDNPFGVYYLHQSHSVLLDRVSGKAICIRCGAPSTNRNALLVQPCEPFNKQKNTTYLEI